MFIYAALLMVQPHSTVQPSLHEMLQLPPDEAGNLVLKGQNIGSIIEVKAIESHNLNPPGFTKYKLTEEPFEILHGCSRKHWVATFYQWPNHPKDGYLSRVPYSTTSVALSSKGQCNGLRYVHVNPGLGDFEAIASLRSFQRISLGKQKVSFSCKSIADDGLCKNRKSILNDLNANQVVTISKSRGEVRLVLSTQSQFVTIVKFKPENLGSVSVERKIPSPF